MAKTVKPGDVVTYNKKQWRVTEIFVSDQKQTIASLHSVWGDGFCSAPLKDISADSVITGAAKLVNDWEVADKAGKHDVADKIRVQLRDVGVTI